MKFFGLAAAIFFGALSANAAEAPRSMWIWEQDAYHLAESPAYLEEVGRFLNEHSIRTVYLYADDFQNRTLLVENPDAYRSVVARLHARGISVYALIGSASRSAYILPAKQEIALKMLRNVLKYNAASARAARFDGVNIDIEPYLLADWRERLELRATQYLHLCAAFMAVKKEAKSRIPIGPALPFWFDGIKNFAWNGRRKSVGDHVQDIFDYIAIMDYRNYAEGRDGIIENARHKLVYADRIHKRVVVGVETLDVQPSRVTFHGLGAETLERELKIAEASFAPHASFAGFAIHHLRPYKAMNPPVVAAAEPPAQR